MTHKEEIREFSDEQTGLRLTIELEAGEQKVTVFPPDNHQDFTYEELNEAVRRLLRLSGLEKESA